MFYSEYQFQQRGEAWGVEGLVVTGGAVHQLTRGKAELYTGGDSTGVNQARNRSAYVQLDQKFGPRLNVSAGARYENFSINDSTASKPVFRAGLNYQPAKATWLRASFGQGFRFPTIAEKFIRAGIGPLQVYPNDSLRPETAVNIEAGLKQGFQLGAMQGFVDVAAFYQEYEDFIEFTFGTWELHHPRPAGCWIQEFEHRLQPRHRMGNLVDGTCHMGRNHPGLVDGLHLHEPHQHHARLPYHVQKQETAPPASPTTPRVSTWSLCHWTRG